MRASTASEHNAITAAQRAGQWRLMWIKFRKHTPAKIGGTVVLLFYLIALLAEFVAPYDPYHRNLPYAGIRPSRIRIRDEEGRFRRPFVWGVKVLGRDPVTLELLFDVDKTRRFPIRFVVRGDPYRMWGIFEGDLHLFGIRGEGDQRINLLGTDRQARDLFSRIVYGSRISLSIGLIGVALSFSLGIVLGAMSGYFGGIVDIIVQRMIEVLIAIPSLPLWMALSASIPMDWPITRVFFVITVILSLLGWTGMAREVRGKLLSLRGEDFVLAARLDGAPGTRVMFRHLIPSFMSHIIARGTLAIPGMIIGETSLSFLGIGLRAPAISWGVLLQSAQNIRAVATTPWLLAPGIFVVVVVLCFNFLGDGLRDAADPYG